MADRLELARELLRRWELPEALRRLGADDLGSCAEDDVQLLYFDGRYQIFLTTPVTPDVLAASLHSRIGLDLRRVADEADIPIGACKHRGLPHLPAGFDWPADRYFMCQLNLAELAPHDRYGVLPTSGMLYLFFDGEFEITAEHYDGPLDALRVTPYPDVTKLPGAQYYLEQFRDRPSAITFEPGCVFYLTGYESDDLAETAALVPDELRRRVAEVVGQPVVADDFDCQIFGRPLYWQGELETDAEEEAEDADDAEHGRGLMLFQDEFGEGHVHLWIDPADARKGNFATGWSDYSGT